MFSKGAGPANSELSVDPIYTIAYEISTHQSGCLEAGSRHRQGRSMDPYFFHDGNIAARLIDVQEVGLVSVLFPMIEVSLGFCHFALRDLVSYTPSYVILIDGVLSKIVCKCVRRPFSKQSSCLALDART